MSEPYENPPIIDLTDLCNTADNATANVVIELAVDGGWIVESTREPPRSNRQRALLRSSSRPPAANSARPPATNSVRPPATNSARPPATNSARPPSRNSARPPARNSARPPTERSARVISPSCPMINGQTTECVNNASPDVIISGSLLSRSHPEQTHHVNVPETGEHAMYSEPHILNPEPIVIADSPQVPTAQRKVARNIRKTLEVVQTEEEQYRERSPLSGNFGRPLCPICLDHIGYQPLMSTKCGHVFCTKCLTLALRREKKCPICRKVLRGSGAYHPLYLRRD